MAADVEVILMKQVASYLAMPIFVVDPGGTLIFYNEPAEALLGRRYDENGDMPLEEWGTIFLPTDADGAQLAPEDLPLTVALAERRPAHGRISITAIDGQRRHLSVTAFPLVGQIRARKLRREATPLDAPTRRVRAERFGATGFVRLPRSGTLEGHIVIPTGARRFGSRSKTWRIRDLRLWRLPPGSGDPVDMTVLIAYATAQGSTKGVAEAIGHGLERSGFTVDVRAADDVDEASGYQAVVLGSAIHNGRWLTPALALLADIRRHERRPLWLFSVCTIGETTSFLGPRLSRLARRKRKLPPDVADAEVPHRWFAGAIDRSHWGAAGRLFFMLTGGRYGDHRDWTDIEQWAVQIGAALTSEQFAP